MKSDLPLTRDLVLIGGGHTHALVLRMWGMNPLAGVRVTVINPAETAPYSGMLPGFVAGHYTKDDLDIDLVRLARFAGARIIIGKATGIDTVARTISIDGGLPVAYDIASIDIGITSDMPDLQGFGRYAIPAKPLDAFARRWDQYRATAVRPRVAVIGGGVAGAELAMAMAHALAGKDAEVRLIDRGTVLDQFDTGSRNRMLAAMKRNGVEVIERADIARVTESELVLSDGRRISADFVTGAAGARPHDWLGLTGLTLHDGFVSVGPTLQSSDKAIFAAGDCAHLSHAPRPKAGVFAVRAAPVLFGNLRAALGAGTMKPFDPQKDYLKLVSLGGKSAMAHKWGRGRVHAGMWRWKDRIDRKFMAMFHDLPAMPATELPAEVADGLRDLVGAVPMCGGCGAKVGRGALRDALKSLPAIKRDDVASERGDDAGVLTVGGQRQVISTDHLRAFMADPRLMTRLAATHALGDIWAMGAQPQAATVNVVLPRMSADMQRRTMTEVIDAAAQVIEKAGAAIVGGHSSLGSEFTIGFTVTGLCDRDPIGLSGARAGDRIIVTKPIGSGVIMAAEMRGLAKGADVVAAYDVMLQQQSVASRVLSDHARAMTDITGFGLAGHLAGICENSGVGAEIDLGAVPVMAGAEALSAQGVRSTIWADNRENCGAVYGAAGAKGDLLFDPQTAGGLMAIVGEAFAEDSLRKLWTSGYNAAIIGRIVDGAGIKVL